MAFFFAITNLELVVQLYNCFYTLSQNEGQSYRMTFFSETEEHFTIKTAVSNMAAISASCNTHYDERLPMTSSAPPEL